MLNRSEIFKAAWAAKRRSTIYTFADCLRMAWFDAKLARAAEVERAKKAAPVAVPAIRKELTATAAQRAAAIRSELEAMSYSNFIPWARHDALSVELARLTA